MQTGFELAFKRVHDGAVLRNAAKGVKMLRRNFDPIVSLSFRPRTGMSGMAA